jgi:DNA-binding winged helix-turn-helix (wHTH) protein/tetratricopeptide (TPR) repeat protein
MAAPQMLTSPSHILRFDNFTLDTVRSVLLRAGSELPLRRQSFEVLRYLAEHVSQVVSSDELIEALWSSKPADRRASVGQCIKEIRRAIGHDARWIIQTVSGDGYKFMAEVVRIGAPPPDVTPLPPASPGYVFQAKVSGAKPSPPELAVAPAVTAGPRAHSSPLLDETAVGSSWLRPWTSRNNYGLFGLCAAVALVASVAGFRWLVWPDQPPTPPRTMTMMAAPTITVLPFTVMGAGDGRNNPAIGLGEEVRSELARAPTGFDLVIKSIADYSKRAPVDNSQALAPEVRYVVRGTTWQHQSIQHASVELIEADTDTQVTAESYAFALDEAEVQNLMAARIARQIALSVRSAESRKPLPETPQAGHFALQGFALIESEEGSQLTLPAQTLFEKALALDANFVWALHGLARIKINMVTGTAWMIPGDWRPTMLDAAEAAIERTIKLNHLNYAAHTLRGSLLHARRDADHAIAAFEHALSLNPNDSEAHAGLARAKIDVGRADEAVADIARSIRLSPTDPLIYLRYFRAGMAAVHIGDDQTAVKWFLKARQANRSYPHSALWLAVAYHRIGEEEKAKAMMVEYRSRVTSFTIAGWKKALATNNPVVAEQRKQIEKVLRRLVPELSSRDAEHRFIKSISCDGFSEFC